MKKRDDLKNKEPLDKRKVLGTIIGGIFFLCCILFFTYAWYEWRSETNTTVVFDVIDGSKTCEVGPDVNVSNIGPVLDYNDGVAATFKVGNSGSEDATFTVNLDITSITDNLLVDSFRYILLKGTFGGTNYEEIGISGNFANFQVGTNVISDSVEIEANSSYSYKLIVYIDGTVYNNETMQEGSMNAGITVGDCDIIGEVNPPNAPNLDDGNLIPVVYHGGSSGNWVRANSTNKNDSWYNYQEKKWANAVLIKDSSRRSYYQNASFGTVIRESDISAFYVWIPRFKYRVWNITRLSLNYSTYAYNAYKKGIDIVFEQGTGSTGNVKCNYNSSTVEGENNLSDVCIYKDTNTITVSSNNKSYLDAWYTHPAFTFGGVEKEGFWIGKFETTGTSTAPTILPDQVALSSQAVDEHFTTSKIFQSYGLSNNVDAHMLTNLEWGAVAYLTHSIFGVCTSDSCKDVYINNSSGYYTGRSAGGIAGTDGIQLVNVYSSTFTTSTDRFSETGYYDYLGRKFYYDGEISANALYESKVASTTRNRTGVYDMSGGSYEYVMGNMVNASGAFYPSSSGTDWNDSSVLDTKYYNSYSRGATYNSKTAFNRARLGDATAEVVGNANVDSGSWQPGVGLTGAYSYFVEVGYPWFVRGGRYNNASAGIFRFYRQKGDGNAGYAFRSAIS